MCELQAGLQLGTNREDQMATILTTQAIEGYEAPAPYSGPCGYIPTSDSFNAWHIGAWLNNTGRTRPRDVRASRGDTYHVNGMKVRIVRHRDCAAPSIERIA